MSQIYRELGTLEAKELVDSEIEVQETRPDRKVYTITPAGKQAFLAWLNQFPLSLLSPCRDEFALRVFFGGRSSRDEMKFQLRRLSGKSKAKQLHLLCWNVIMKRLRRKTPSRPCTAR